MNEAIERFFPYLFFALVTIAGLVAMGIVGKEDDSDSE